MNGCTPQVTHFVKLIESGFSRGTIGNLKPKKLRSAFVYLISTRETTGIEQPPLDFVEAVIVQRAKWNHLISSLGAG
ncbi:MAG: hypothetical protein ABW065_04170 [Solirubrobacterales bacterium]